MPAVTFARLYQEMEAVYKPPFRKKATWDKLKKVLREFQDLPGVRKTSDITPPLIIKWAEAHAHRAPITNRSYLGSFRAAVNYAVKMRWLRISPWEFRTDWIPDEAPDDDEEDAEDQRSADRYHSIESILRWMDTLDCDALVRGWEGERLQALGYTYALTALRKREALGLKVSDVNLDAGTIRLKPRKKRTLKTRKSAGLIGIPPDLLVIYQRWVPRCESIWLFPNKAKRATPWLYGTNGAKALDQIKDAGKRSGIDNLTIHSLRRSTATHAKRMGMSLLEIRDLLRHTDQRTTQDWYIEDDAANMKAIAARISYRQFATGADRAN